MSHTNQTPNYHLPQFIGTDKPAWLVDFNQSMSDIDTQMKANETASATAEANAQSALSGVTALNSQVGGLQTDVTAIQTQMPLDEAQIATNAQNISTQASAIVNANNRIDTANANITALNTKVGDLADLDTRDKTSVINAVNELNADMVPVVLKDVSDLSVSENTIYDTGLDTDIVRQYKYICVAIKTAAESDRWRKIFIPIFSDDYYIVCQSYFVSDFVNGVYYSRSIDVGTNAQAHITVMFGERGYSGQALKAVRIVGYK